MSLVMRFVDSPDADRSIRLDLNAEPPRQGDFPFKTLREGTDLAAPQLERTSSAPVARDGDAINASRYGNRSLTLMLRVYGDAVTFAAAMHALARELDRETNWLEFQPGNTDTPVFFHTFRGDISRLDLTNAGAGSDKWDVEVPLLAEPFAFGAEVTGTATIGNDPASGQVATLPTITGDVAAPLNVEAVWTSNQFTASTVLLSRHVTTSTPIGRVEQIDSTWTMQPDASLQANDAAMSGSGQNYARVTFAINTALASRAIKTITAVPVGTYKVFARVRKSSSIADVDVRLQTGQGSFTNGPTRRIGGTDAVVQGPVWVDLGTVTSPEGATVPRGVTTASLVLRLQAGRVSGTGTFDFDVIRLVPVCDFGGDVPDADTSWLHHALDGQVGEQVTLGWDIDNERVYSIVAGTAGKLPLRPGPLNLRVLPGWANHLTFMRHIGTTYTPGGALAATDKLADSTVINWSYRPRWLYLSEPS